MGRKNKFSKEIKIKSCEDFLSGNKSALQLSKELHVAVSTVRFWANAYKAYGQVAFDEKPRNKSYSKEVKLQAVRN